MAVTTVNKDMVSGRTKVMPFSAVDNDGDAVTVTGGSATYKIADTPYSTALVTKTSAAGDITLAGSTVTVTLEPADTEDLDGIYYHELEVIDGGANEYTGFSGAIVVRRNLI
jgi:hypothetical protein